MKRARPASLVRLTCLQRELANGSVCQGFGPLVLAACGLLGLSCAAENDGVPTRTLGYVMNSPASGVGGAAGEPEVATAGAAGTLPAAPSVLPSVSATASATAVIPTAAPTLPPEEMEEPDGAGLGSRPPPPATSTVRPVTTTPPASTASGAASASSSPEEEEEEEEPGGFFGGGQPSTGPAPSGTGGGEPSEEASWEEAWAVMSVSCATMGCHGAFGGQGGLSLSAFDAMTSEQNATMFAEQIAAAVGESVMPPLGGPMLSDADRATIVAWASAQ